jgi:hypothetical protein
MALQCVRWDVCVVHLQACMGLAGVSSTAAIWRCRWDAGAHPPFPLVQGISSILLLLAAALIHELQLSWIYSFMPSSTAPSPATKGHRAVTTLRWF